MNSSHMVGHTSFLALACRSSTLALVCKRWMVLMASPQLLESVSVPLTLELDSVIHTTLAFFPTWDGCAAMPCPICASSACSWKTEALQIMLPLHLARLWW